MVIRKDLKIRSVLRADKASDCVSDYYFVSDYYTLLSFEQRRKIRFSQQEGNKSEAELTAEDDFLDSFLNVVNQYGSVQQE